MVIHVFCFIGCLKVYCFFVLIMLFLHLSMYYLKMLYFIFVAGHFLLTNLLLDKLKASPNGRVISLVSPIFKKGEIYFQDLNSAKDYFAKEAYAQSKLALVFFTQELARRLKGKSHYLNENN